ncbi:MAG: DNA cytosine methyltransferase [Nostoc sp. ChiQUE02]|uniref:DNA cytosine methyltransferase n=1 Tax=Nostoc sp. ChiQUE02 TaxID=3075377 RepID=UPI002AD44047|nr:DNA cytosine methyltransferase [Nostoc sp. ChiQUE02]MDZ8231262.1 DNA cytosine methyltransferase [Nostoc sp. ChiQUE02]
MVASRGFRVALPSGTTPCGWYGAIAHLIPTMPDSQLLPKQRQAVEQFLMANEPTPLLIERVGGRNRLKYKPGHLPSNTILRSHFTDHKGCNRSKFADIWLPDGAVKSLSIEGAAILQGFPGWYEFPNETATAGSIIGYSVPPSFATQLFIRTYATGTVRSPFYSISVLQKGGLLRGHC